MTARFQGRVHWFCNTSGDGVIVDTEGNSWYLHWSAVRGDFPAKNGKKSWVELKGGEGVEFSITCRQADHVEITDHSPIADTKVSAFRDRGLMKQKLAAAEAMFSEEFPISKVKWDRYRKLESSSKPLTDAQRDKLVSIQQQIAHERELVRIHNERKTAVICSIYREHSNSNLFAKEDNWLY